MNRFHFSFLLPLTFVFSGCTNNGGPVKKPVADKTTDTALAAKNNSASGLFDLTKPSHTWRLPDQLVEVSGNSWVDANRLVLIEDLHPALYLIKLDDKNAKLEKTIPFAETEKDKVDIEDVSVVDNAVYALWSHGVLFKISDWQGTPKVEKIKTGLTKENNTEGLCYDPVSKTLLIACKDDAGIGDDKKSARAVYQFDMNKQTLMRPPYMVIHSKDFEKVTSDKLRFNPSAIAVQPTTHDIYILTTKDNKGMAIFSHDGVLKSYQPIDKELMPQPEGICFSPDGKLYMSSEGKKGEPGNLFEFDK
jgi:uncharacterized protein YjiK